MAISNVRVEERGPAGIVTVDRPKALNALDAATLQELRAAVADLGAKRGLAGIVVQGGGEKAFVAGGDIGAMATMAPLEAQRYSEEGHALLQQMLACPKVTVAAIQGYALGGGLELALMCDLRVASEEAQLGLPEVSLGVIPGFGGTQRLPRIIGEARAKELILTGERVPAARALELGLVNRVVPRAQLLDAALDYVERVAKHGPLAVRIAKDAVQRGLDLPLGAGLALEARAFATTFATRDQREGMQAFLERRPPTYEGR
ncbi:MAG TPA: enoyl-CoA hydratase-related protein [Candidatus Thermoplasmatota archaeon]|jgi:enoyl-CoA hydratase|nr:enoyl-CoA hydratase-related protein [Candidatus Thermoplasmatota archaeon]